MPFAEEEFLLVRDHDCEPELRFLLAAANRRDQPIDLAAVARDIGKIDPARLFDLARLNKMINVLPFHRCDLPEGCDELAPRIDQARLYTLALNRRGLIAGMEISGLLHKAGIAHLHFKGPLQQIALYDTYLQKPSADVDILVNPRDHRHAASLIKAKSFVQLDSHNALWWQNFLGEIHLRHRDSGVLVDLHHALQQPGLPRPRRLQDFFEQRSVINFEGAEFQVPSAPHRVLIAAIALSKAFLAREPALSSLVDLRAALARLEPAEIHHLDETTRALGLEQTLGLALRMLDAVFPSATPTLKQFGQTLPTLNRADLRLMVTTPWRAGLPWLRRHRLMAELCDTDPLRFSHEFLRAAMSEGLRRTLEWMPRNKRLSP